MKVEKLLNITGSEFFTGVPDSQLKPLCDYLMDRYGVDPHYHVIAANEGNCAALAAGYHLATGKIPIVYMQNSGEGNIINPVASLLNEKVYAIPMIFIIGWRGEPGVHDEPQHKFQGEITLKLLDDLNIAYFIIDAYTSDDAVYTEFEKFKTFLQNGRQVAFVIKKNALEFDKKITYANPYAMSRESAIERIVEITREDIVVSTTGKASRELFEIRERNKMSHKYDFLTVGSMGHSSSIALGIAISKPNDKIWIIDGDGAALMHMGSLAVIGANKPRNLVHIVINNGAHETVGGMPTVADNVNLVEIARACGYVNAVSVCDEASLTNAVLSAKSDRQLSFIEVKCALGSRANLGRPTTTAIENKQSFMLNLKEKH